MNEAYIEDKAFVATSIIDKPLYPGVYDGCDFNSCDFLEHDLSNFSFIDCTFSNCNLSNVKINNSVFRDVCFKNCKMIGIHFYTTKTNNFTATFTNCQLDYCSFHKLKMQNFIFTDCSLQFMDFINADLTNTKFENCNLMDTVFENTCIVKADFTTAYNYKINPENNKIKNAKFGLSGLPGLLASHRIVIDFTQ